MVRNSNKQQPSSSTSSSIAAWAQWVPLRLTAHERSLLTVLEQALHVSEYTDNVDVAAASLLGGGRGGTAAGSKTRRILEGITEACHIASGLVECTGQERTIAEMCKENHALSEKLSTKKKKQHHGSSSTKDPAATDSNETTAANTAATAGGRSTHDGNKTKKDPADNEVLFQTMFEIGRRNKVLNPASMRATYGKLMYVLQDAQTAAVKKSLGFSLHKELLLTGPYLQQHGCGALLDDPRLECAIQYISDRDLETGERLDRVHVDALVQGKQRVKESLVQHYAQQCENLSADEIRRAIESLADAVALNETNVRPVECMLNYLQANFDAAVEQEGFSLALHGSTRSITFGSPITRYGYSAYGGGGVNDDDDDDKNGGAKLNHTHNQQYTFVWQSLRLWRTVLRNLHRLWVCADADLLSTSNKYHLYNTGQGLNRVQHCPRVRKLMNNLLQQVQNETGGSTAWVGLSVVHLGDRDVPNALIFIDKYTQIPRFLGPIVDFLQRLPELCDADKRIARYIGQEFESVDQLKKIVLADYFKHGFDGSGDDGGSCIDGRLTSSWNWTSRLSKKKYYHAFLLSGFEGFDGSFL